MRKKIGLTKYPQEKKSVPRNTRHDGCRPMRPTMARDSRNLAHSFLLHVQKQPPEVFYKKAVL